MAMKHAEMWVLGVAGAAVLLLCVVCILLQPTQASGGAQETIGNCEVDVEAMVDLATDSDNDGVINPDKEEPFEQDLLGEWSAGTAMVMPLARRILPKLT